MYGPEILDLFDTFGPLPLGPTAESWAQDGCRCDRFPRYPYIRGSSRCSLDVTDITLSQTAESPRQPFIRDSSGSSPNVAEITL